MTISEIVKGIGMAFVLLSLWASIFVLLMILEAAMT